jgi:hypothetical protein
MHREKCSSEAKPGGESELRQNMAPELGIPEIIHALTKSGSQEIFLVLNNLDK